MSTSSANKPVDCDVDFDPGNLAGKTAIVTGGQTIPTQRVLNVLTIHRSQWARRSLRARPYQRQVCFVPTPALHLLDGNTDNDDRAYVCFGDLNEQNGQKLASELTG